MISGNNVVSGDFLKVLLTLEDRIKFDLNVADLAIVKEINGDYYTCEILNNNALRIKCIKLKDLEINLNNCVLILYTNDDYRNNLEKLKNNEKPQNYDTELLHTKAYGVIIGIIL